MPRIGLGIGISRGGYRNPLAPLKKCGMIQYSKGSTNGVLIDKVGKSTRGAVQGRTLVGNGQTYVNTGIIPNQNTVLRVWGNFNSLTSPSTVQYHGTRVAWNDRAYGFGINGAQWIFAYGNGFNGVGTSDTLAHAFEINDGKFYVDGAMLSDRKANYMSGITLEIFLQALNAGSATSQSNFNMTACEIVHDGVTYTLNIEERQSTGILSFNGSDGTKKLLQQYLSPATATVVNNTVESAFDLYGGTIADGTQTMDQAGTIFFDVNTPISVNPNDGLIMGYVNGVRVAPEYSGRVRYNRVVCDVSGTPTGGEITPTGYIKLADKYNGITKYDTNRIQTETDGTGKVLPIADMLHVTNNQMFATEDKKDIGFFDKELTGDCKNKAITFFKQGEQLTDQNGDLLFDAQGNALFTFKPWVTN